MLACLVDEMIMWCMHENGHCHECSCGHYDMLSCGLWVESVRWNDLSEVTCAQ